jgi:meiotically up-regulated gene 157 (Mug157) protein
MIDTDGESTETPYLFQRLTQVATDTLMIGGRGPPAKKCGLTRSLFRPSDDSVTLPYNIPGNAMACTELMHLQDLLTTTKLGIYIYIVELCVDGVLTYTLYFGTFGHHND